MQLNKADAAGAHLPFNQIHLPPEKEDSIMFEQIKTLLIEELQIDAEDITLEAELVNDLGINSLELADLVLLCEERFNIEINDEEIHKFISVGDVVTYLEALA